MKRYKRLLLALCAIASIYVVRATGLDRGLIDEVFEAAVEAFTDEPESAPEPNVPANHFDNPERCSDCHK